MRKRITGIVLGFVLCSALCGCGAKEDAGEKSIEEEAAYSELAETEGLADEEAPAEEEKTDGVMQEEAAEETPSEIQPGAEGSILDVTEEWVLNSEEDVAMSNENSMPSLRFLLPAKSNNYMVISDITTNISFDGESGPVFIVKVVFGDGNGMIKNPTHFDGGLDIGEYDNGTYAVKVVCKEMGEDSVIANFGFEPDAGGCGFIQATVQNVPIDVVTAWAEENFELMKEQADLLAEE